MQFKGSVFIATSLDGYIARTDGGIDWLDVADSPPQGEDYGYQAHWDGIDTLILGRHSFDMVVSFGQWPYDGKRVVVLSSGQPAIPDHLAGKVQVMSGTAQELAGALWATGTRRAYVDGGKTIQVFLRAGLIEEMIITLIPVILGEGIPLFGPLAADVKLDLVDAKKFENGLVQVHYRPIYQTIEPK